MHASMHVCQGGNAHGRMSRVPVSTLTAAASNSQHGVQRRAGCAMRLGGGMGESQSYVPTFDAALVLPQADWVPPGLEEEAGGWGLPGAPVGGRGHLERGEMRRARSASVQTGQVLRWWETRLQQLL